MFYPASVLLGGFLIYARGDKLLGKESVALIDFFGNFPAYVSQIEKTICIHIRKPPSRRTPTAWLMLGFEYPL